MLQFYLYSYIYFLKWSLNPINDAQRSGLWSIPELELELISIPIPVLELELQAMELDLQKNDWNWNGIEDSISILQSILLTFSILFLIFLSVRNFLLLRSKKIVRYKGPIALALGDI